MLLMLRKGALPKSKAVAKPTQARPKAHPTRRMAMGKYVGILGIVSLGSIASIGCAADGAVKLHRSGSCGDPFAGRGYGPFDYRTATTAQKKIVESVHFTSEVESLQSGASATLGGDLDYTLQVFPNHARALMALIRLGQRDKTTQPKGARYTVECYVERAVAYRPDDTNVRQMRGIFYSMNRKYDLAIADFTSVIEKQPDNANAHYNLGLAYFETGNYDAANAQARVAQKLGFALPGLMNKLKAKGKWSD